MNIRFIKPIAAFVLLLMLGLTYNSMDMFIVEDEPEEVVAKVVDPKQLACMAKNIFCVEQS